MLQRTSIRSNNMKKTTQQSASSKVKHTSNSKVSVAFSRELFAEIERAAKEEDRPVSNWIMRAAKEKLERMGV